MSISDRAKIPTGVKDVFLRTKEEQIVEEVLSTRDMKLGQKEDETSGKR